MNLSEIVVNKPIFIFDDERGFLELFKKRLQKKGFKKIHSTSNVRRALRLVRDNKYYAYCVDMETPKSPITGKKIISEIIKYNRNCHIELISAHKKYEDKCADIHADHFTGKPIRDYQGFSEYLKEKVMNVAVSEEDIGQNSDIRVLSLIHDISKILNTNNEIKNIVSNVFGGEIAEIKDKIKEIDQLYSLAQGFNEKSKDYVALAENLLERLSK